MERVQATVAGVRRWMLAPLLLGVFAGPAFAQQKGDWFAGGGLDDDKSVFGGVQYALPGSRLGSGWAVRGSAYTGSYSYVRDNHEIDADYTGGEAALLYQWSGAWGYADAGAIARYVDTDLSPYDRLNPRRGSQVSAAFSAEGMRIWGPWKLSGFAEYGVRIEDYLVRASLTHQITDRLRLGLDTSTQGDETYNRQHVGVLAGYAFTPSSELQISTGLSRQNSRSDRAYFGLLFNHAF